MNYRDRREAKADRLREWADKREAKAEATREKVDEIAGMIPFGQPILVGHHSEGRHRRDADRIHNGMRKSIDKERGERAYKHLVGYANEHSDGDVESAITDLIADIAHLADDGYDGGEDALRMGGVHYRAERDGE